MIVSRLLKIFRPGDWPSIKNLRINPVALFIILAHQITFSCSPLTVALVELTRARNNVGSHSGRRFTKPIDQHVSLNCNRIRPHKESHEEDWFNYLLRPSKLLKFIKQYHCVGNMFFILLVIQFITIFYLLFKALFHKHVTGTDQRLAQYYADRYFPRAHHSYPRAHDLDSFLIRIYTYVLVFRLFRLYVLVKNSVINRNGYVVINTSQLNFSSASAIEIPVHKWNRFIDIVLHHHKAYDNDSETRKKHLRFEKNIAELMDKKDEFEFMYLYNPISFDDCYKAYFDITRQYKSSWAKGWYVSMPIGRIDPSEFGLLITIATVGCLLAMIIVAILVVLATFHELCTLAKEAEQYSCVAQVPALLLDISRLVRLFDIVSGVMVQLPQQVEAAMLYFDCCSLISRARKVTAALQEDLDICINSTRTSGIDMGPLRERKALNRAIHLHIRLTRVVYHEFRDIRETHTLLLNILLVGGGSLISVCASEVLQVKDSFVKRFVLEAYIVSCLIPIILSIVFCIKTEYTVSKRPESYQILVNSSESEFLRRD